MKAEIIGRDIEGNPVAVGDVVYINDAANIGSKSKRFLRGEVTELNSTGRKVKVRVFENDMYYQKLTRSILRPLMQGANA